MRSSLREGRLWTTITRFGGSEGFVGAPTFPELTTAENLLHEPPRLVIDGAVVGSGDADRDGLPDDWERYHFGGLPAVPDADPDGDGSPNLAEWQDGIDPTIPDALRIQAEQRADGRMSLWWPGIANGTDTLESSADLQRWAPVPGTLDYRERGIVRWATALDAGSAFRCYRVCRVPSAP